MEQFDREKAQRVWQRVQARQSVSPPQYSVNQPPAPEGFVLEELMDGEAFLQLARQEKEPANGPLRRLAAQAQERAAILKGICRLVGTAYPTQLPKTAGQDNIQAALRRLMGRLLRRHEQYCQLSEGGEFAPLYQELAQKIQHSMVLLAQAIGK